MLFFNTFYWCSDLFYIEFTTEKQCVYFTKFVCNLYIIKITIPLFVLKQCTPLLGIGPCIKAEILEWNICFCRCGILVISLLAFLESLNFHSHIDCNAKNLKLGQNLISKVKEKRILFTRFLLI